ncbi:hypothetical protein [Sulfitobacter sabulilitoris]|uniref:Capsular biosynthesis protein n=1 Tax=Sulfitobacter sabulilitoris TaxID=2562655 RepID=A0A5S3PEV7_9RHOB|nr:hypothetical protein [Sulfitobacter sabulilitoris]TMM52590.1 hypothetical protein FDT80_09940 [Sulfitobacter sabulilitoris]
MTDQATLRFHLEDGLRQSAAAGEHNFIAKIAQIAQRAGMDVEYSKTPPRADGAYTLTHMNQPPDAKGLMFRRVYHYPFWQIEQTAARWAWDVARADFAPDTIDPDTAARFHAYWQKRLFGDAPQSCTQDGYVYVPLQGRLSEHRSFQSRSPFAMIEACLEHDPNRHIVATLHPKETYSQADLAMLERLELSFPRLSVRMGGMEELLRGCDYVVTQNSSAAFFGNFFAKPAILFAQIDFHHIALKAQDEDLKPLFEAAPTYKPDFARYVWWFWQDQSINAGRPDAEDKILARLRRFGWPL